MFTTPAAVLVHLVWSVSTDITGNFRCIVNVESKVLLFYLSCIARDKTSSTSAEILLLEIAGPSGNGTTTGFLFSGYMSR
jgi:hypothetical protein